MTGASASESGSRPCEPRTHDASRGTTSIAYRSPSFFLTRLTAAQTAIDAARQGFHPNLVETLARSSPEALEASGALDEVVEHRSALRADYLSQLAAAAGLGYAQAKTPQSVAALATDHAVQREERADRDVRFVFGIAAALLLATEWLGADLRNRTRGIGASRRDVHDARLPNAGRATASSTNA